METKQLIEQLEHHIKYHLAPYNLGDEGKTMELIKEAIALLCQIEPLVMQKIAEELNTTIKALAESKYESVNEQPITNNNWNKMIKQSERYGAYKTLIELRRKFAEIDSNFSA